MSIQMTFSLAKKSIYPALTPDFLIIKQKTSFIAGLLWFAALRKTLRIKSLQSCIVHQASNALSKFKLFVRP